MVRKSSEEVSERGRAGEREAITGRRFSQL